MAQTHHGVPDVHRPLSSLLTSHLTRVPAALQLWGFLICLLVRLMDGATSVGRGPTGSLVGESWYRLWDRMLGGMKLTLVALSGEESLADTDKETSTPVLAPASQVTKEVPVPRGLPQTNSTPSKFPSR